MRPLSHLHLLQPGLHRAPKADSERAPADLVTTLGSLALTSRQFLEPAQHALLYDPTRILATRSNSDAHTLLNRIIQQPTLGAQVKRLEGLVDMFDHVEGLSLYWEHPPAFMNWAVTLLRLCPNTVAVSIWPDPSAGWLAALALLPRLRHLTVACRGDSYNHLDIIQFTTFVETLPFAQLESLTLHDYYGPTHLDPFLLHVPVARFELVAFHEGWHALRLCLGDVRHLTLRPDVLELDEYTVLPASLETFVLRPDITQAQLERFGDRACSWEGLFMVPRHSVNLRTIVLDTVIIHPVSLGMISTSAPHLEHLELRNALWHHHEGHFDGQLLDAIAGLPRLRFLHLGKLPDPPCSILDTRVYCRLFDIELEWRGVELEQLEAPSTAPPSREVSERGSERSADEDEAMMVGLYGAFGDWRGDVSSVEGDYEAQRPVRSAQLGHDLDPSSATSSSPFPSLPRPLSPYSSNTFSPLDPISYACRPSRLSPSPTPTLDDGTLSGVVFARTAAAEQRYVAEPAWQPRLEDGYEATDDGVDEGLDEAEPWEGWADECDLGEADRAWREYDDEGEDECVGRLWLVEGDGWWSDFIEEEDAESQA